MDDVHPASLQPPRQPKPVAPRLKGEGNPFNRPAAVTASARQRSSSRSNATGLGSCFFNGWRSRPGTNPATSQLASLSSTTTVRAVF